MKKALCIPSAIFLAFSLTACSAPSVAELPKTSESETVTQTILESTSVKPQISESTSVSVSQTEKAPTEEEEFEAALQAAKSVDEIGQIMKPYVISEDYEIVLQCTDRMLEIDPESEMAWYVRTEMQMLLLLEKQKELYGTITKGLEKLDDPVSYANWVKHFAQDNGIVIELPFFSDYRSEEEINTYGVTGINYYNGGGLYGTWQNGVLTSQGDWVYYSVPNEGYAIYKMRVNGENKLRLGDENGCCLNVVGDWIYYCNINANNSIFKMRTDGSERTKISDDNCKYMAVCGEWIVYVNMNEGECLFRMKLDGSERKQLVKNPVMYPYLYDDRVYFRYRDDRSFYSVSLDGGDLRREVPYIEGYFINDDWIYYITDEDGMVLKRMRTDRSDVSTVYRFMSKGGYAIYLDGSIIVNEVLEGSDHEQAVSIDLDTMEKTVLVDEWCEMFYVARGMGYYLDYEEGHRWYYVNLSTGETGNLD